MRHEIHVFFLFSFPSSFLVLLDRFILPRKSVPRASGMQMPLKIVGLERAECLPNYDGDWGSELLPSYSKVRVEQ